MKNILAMAILLFANSFTFGQTVNFTQKARDIKVESPRNNQFAYDVVLHVVLHEVAHALIREFDLPILGNEETMADAFATHYLVTKMPDRALEVLKARVTSLIIEAKEVPRDQWEVRGEHNNDARRAYQIVALALSQNREKYLPLAKIVKMSDRDISNSCDYGTEIQRSWRRILNPLWMPEGQDSREVGFHYDPSNKLIKELAVGKVATEIESVLKRFDWHSQVKIKFEEGAGGAGWSRSARTITVKSEYIERFIRQSEQAETK